MSTMKLRDRVRAPMRYGEDEDEIPRRSSLRPGNAESPDEEYTEVGESDGPRRKKRKRSIVQYNPNLPPAAFPSLDRPHSESTNQAYGQVSAANRPSGPESLMVSLPLHRGARRNASSLVDDGLEGVPLAQLENHLASNNMDNPIYARNVRLAYGAHVGSSSPEDKTQQISDDELPDAEQVLLEKVNNPRWKDLSPAMQVEIFENMMQDFNFNVLCRLLGLGFEEYRKIDQYRKVRNKQILRENNHLEQMRAKQRSVLMDIDNSDLKMFQPPPQLVLKKIVRDTTRRMVNKHTDLLMCQSHDILKARQFLHKRGLYRRYAGDWGDSLVTLRESDASGADPDAFEWKEELKFTPPPAPTDPAQVSALQNDDNFVRSFGGGAIAPSSMTRRDTDLEPTLDWGKYYHRQRDDLPWDTTKSRDGGMLKLTLSSGKTARMAQSERSTSERVTWPREVSQITTARGDVQRVERPTFFDPRFNMRPVAMTEGRMPHFAMSEGGMMRNVVPQPGMASNALPQDVMGQGARQWVNPWVYYPPTAIPQHLMTQGMPPHRQLPMSDQNLPLPRGHGPDIPSNEAQGGTKPVGPSTGIRQCFSSPFARGPARPISRRLTTGDYYRKDMTHVESQARFNRQMEQARLEHEQTVQRAQAERAQAERANSPSAPQPSGVGARSPPPRGLDQTLLPHAVSFTSLSTFNWVEHQTAMSAGDNDAMEGVINADRPPKGDNERSG